MWRIPVSRQRLKWLGCACAAFWEFHVACVESKKSSPFPSEDWRWLGVAHAVRRRLPSQLQHRRALMNIEAWQTGDDQSAKARVPFVERWRRQCKVRDKHQHARSPPSR